MQSVGTKLREARGKNGYTLDEISARTRINTRNLNAIESDRVSEISSPFFYRSFVRQYAQEVGIEYIQLSSAVEMLAGNMRQPDLPGQGEHPPLRVAPIQARVKRDYSWIFPAAVFVAVIVLGSGGYTARKYYKVGSLIQTPAVIALTQKKIEATVPKPILPEIQPVAPAALTPVVTDKIHLELAATERTWLTVSADGKPAYTGILEATEKKVLDGQDNAELRTGNAGGVYITFNGKPIGTVGPRGKTRTVLFTKTGYEVQSSHEPRPVPANHIGG